MSDQGPIVVCSIDAIRRQFGPSPRQERMTLIRATVERGMDLGVVPPGFTQAFPRQGEQVDWEKLRDCREAFQQNRHLIGEEALKEVAASLQRTWEEEPRLKPFCEELLPVLGARGVHFAFMSSGPDPIVGAFAEGVQQHSGITILDSFGDIDPVQVKDGLAYHHGSTKEASDFIRLKRPQLSIGHNHYDHILFKWARKQLVVGAENYSHAEDAYILEEQGGGSNVRVSEPGSDRFERYEIRKPKGGVNACGVDKFARFVFGLIQPDEIERDPRYWQALDLLDEALKTK